jgi:hypothetical protein
MFNPVVASLTQITHCILFAVSFKGGEQFVAKELMSSYFDAVVSIG